MSDFANNQFSRSSHPTLACYMCRKRKIKCGRELPQCAICVESEQECNYPAKPRKPGPRIGSTHSNSQKSLPKSFRSRRHHSHRPITSAGPEGVQSHVINTQEQQNVGIKAGEANQPPTINQSSPASAQSLPSQSSAVSSTGLSLSFCIHPTFEHCSPVRKEPSQNPDGTEGSYIDALATTCCSLGLTLRQLNILLPLYFEVVTTFQLFRLTEFQLKLRHIKTTAQRTALLAAMLAFGLKGLDHNDVNRKLEQPVMSESAGAPSIHFRGLAIKYMEEAIMELGDEPFSLALLQALILNTHCLLIQGVRGRAWRYLGTCIRTAYELNLHLIDAGKNRPREFVNADQWCVEEEWRRSWWAIWEMDIFASVIRRCPAGLDLTQNHTFLPAEDERWYLGEPQESAYLEINVNSRWKSLVESKNKSPKAWFIVINSMMKDAQTISSPISIDKPFVSGPTPAQVADNGALDEQQRQQTQEGTAAIKRLRTILNALYCAVMALPNELKYHGQPLNFHGIDLQRSESVTEQLKNSSIYSIYLMVQLTKLMVLKYYVFRSGTKWSFGENKNMVESPACNLDRMNESSTGLISDTSDAQYLAQYFEAADSVVNLMRGCSEEHYKHVNPFLASTAWLAGAVQLLHSSCLPHDHLDRDLIISNFELLCLTYQRTVEFWNMSKVPLRNWEVLKQGLVSIKENSVGDGLHHYEPPCIFTAGTMGYQSSSNTFTQPEQRSNNREEYNSVNEIFKYLAHDHGMRDSFAPNADPLGGNGALSTHAPPPVVQQQHSYDLVAPTDMYSDAQFRSKQPQDQRLSMATAPSNPEIEVEQLSSFSVTESQVAFSPEFLQTMPFTVDRPVDTEFSNYLDEMFSGSYLP